jgi:putative tryptophan/tyrosine transport system substrate-binding protein
MKGRDFITLLGGAAAAWPIAARAQQPEMMRRVGVLIGASESDSEYRTYAAAFKEALAKLGWVEGRNVRFNVRFGEGDPKPTRDQATELVGLSPEVIFAQTALSARTLRQQTQVIPIVFSGAGPLSDDSIVRNIARPEGNITGFTNIYATMGGKLLELLKETAPRLLRIGCVFNSETVRSAMPPLFPSTEEAAQRLAVKAIRTPFRDDIDLERVMAAFAAEPDGGLIMHPRVARERELLLRLAAQHRLPMTSARRSDVEKRPHLLWSRLQTRGSGSCILCRSHPARCQGERPAGRIPNQVRAGDQSQDREGARPYGATDSVAYCRRGDRITSSLCWAFSSSWTRALRFSAEEIR